MSCGEQLDFDLSVAADHHSAKMLLQILEIVLVGAEEDAEALSGRRKVMVNDRDGFRTSARAAWVNASDEFPRFVLDADPHPHRVRRPERPGQCSEGQRPSLPVVDRSPSLKDLHK